MDWWKESPVVKMHYQMTLEDGPKLAIFRNMKTGAIGGFLWHQMSFGKQFFVQVAVKVVVTPGIWDNFFADSFVAKMYLVGAGRLELPTSWSKTIIQLSLDVHWLLFRM